MKDTSQRDFELAQMAGDAVSMAIGLCGRKQDKCAKFPKYLYPTYVDRILGTSMHIHKMIIVANEMPFGDLRLGNQRDAVANCVYLSALVQISFEHGWISSTQCERWIKLIRAIKYKTLNWIKSDINRV